MIEDIDAEVGLENVPVVVAQQFPRDSLGLFPQCDIQLNVLLDVFLEDGLGVHKVLLEVLLENTDQSYIA